MAYDDISNTEQKEQIAQNTIDSQSDTDSMEYYESDSYVPSSESSDDDGDGEVTSINLKRLSSESPKKHNDRPITMDNDEDNFPNTTCDADSVIEMNINPNNESETVVNVENASDRADNDITGPEEQITDKFVKLLRIEAFATHCQITSTSVGSAMSWFNFICLDEGQPSQIDSSVFEENHSINLETPAPPSEASDPAPTTASRRRKQQDGPADKLLKLKKEFLKEEHLTLQCSHGAQSCSRHTDTYAVKSWQH
ncbi:hypothetical protein LSTR_LSTR000042 [Laodelphax striatellus]|uniref:Uncharacterized protein n=1 Tax=Laodelphax striatellus TaxID=195883 RepID=A0A482X771_LAOST|nr:hypothetical protein LSTR_LSTR000042 [Laodelphax striatellus]